MRMVTASLTSSSDQQAAEQQEGAEHTSAAAAGAAAAGAAPAASDPPPTAPIKQTMANLDALLGIEPEVEPAVLAVQVRRQRERLLRKQRGVPGVGRVCPGVCAVLAGRPGQAS